MGRVGWRVVAFVLTGVGLLEFGLLGRAQAQETQAPVVFARPSVSIPDGGSAGLTLFNNTTVELLLTVRVSPADAFEVETSAPSVGPGSSVALRVTDVAAGPGAGGRVTVVAATPGPGNVLAPRQSGVARATVSVATPGRPAEPLVSEWSVTSYRFMPWGDSTENEVLPLRDATACDDLRLPDGTVGGVAAEVGSARVVASCTDEGAPGADVGAELAFPGLGHHTGDYRGEIDLAPGDDDGLVALSVRRTDYVLLPLVVGLLGVGAAVAALRRFGRRDDRASGDRDGWLLLAEVDGAHRSFAAKAHDASWAGYSFKADADDRLRAVLSGAEPSRSRPRNGGVHDDFGGENEIEPIAVAAAAWPRLADRLAELDVALNEVALKAASHRPADGSPEPACLAAARSLLVSPDPLDVSEALAVATIVDDTATLTGGWLDWAAAVAQLESRADLVALAIDDLPADHEDQRRLTEARAKLAAARAELWAVEDLAGLDERRTLPTIREARTLLDGLDHHVSGDAVPVREPASTDALAARRSASPLAAALAGGPGVRHGRSARRSGAGGAVALAGTAFVAVWSGLSVLYAGEAFGSPRDYLAVFAWGFVAQAVLGTLLAAVARWFTLAPSGGAGAPAGA
jgi:hypothetical protein